MGRISAVALALAALAGPVFALDVPDPVPEDPNMRVVAYNPRQRVQIIGTVGRATNITVSRKERIVRVVFGAEGLWEGPDPADVKQGLKNNLPLWPRKPGTTNLILTTEDETATEHAYHYILISRPSRADAEGDDPDATYGLIHAYPERERVERVAQQQAGVQVRRVAWQAARQRRQEAVARAQLEQDALNAPCRNSSAGQWRYTGQGDVSLAPVSICDDGQQTFLRYQGNLRLPGVFMLGADGTEQAVPFAMQGDTMVVQRVAEELHLRLGDAVLYVFNLAYNPIGLNPATGYQADPGTGTASPNVVRALRGAGLP